MSKLNVMMLGPARSVKGGMTTVVDGYYNGGLDRKVNLKYIETVNDKKAISKLFSILIGFIEYISCIREYDIVHIHMASRLSTFRKAIYVRISKHFGKKVILHIHGAEYKIFYNEECNERKRKHIRKTLELADHIIVLSEEWKDFFKSLVDENKIIVLYNAIKIPKDFEKKLNNKNILFLGRIGDRKGIFDLLDVISVLSKKYCDIKLYAGGDGEIARFKKYVKKKHIEQNVQYIGWASGKMKKKLLFESSYYVLPSYNEGMPMSVLEGMAYKNITISTCVGGIPKVINNNQNGIIVCPGDKKALYEALETLFNNPEMRKKLSSNARKTIEDNFNIANNIKEIINIYSN